ncbi:MAG TPA: type VI secretion system tube protein Hcp [Polyangiaceae bacterium]
MGRFVPKAFAVPVLSAGALVFGGVAFAGDSASFTDGTVIRACVDPFGFVRIIDHDRQCPRPGRVIAWNQQGPQGPAGPSGPAGAQGPEGLQGLTGATGPQGLQGDVGPMGEPGVDGAQGIAGPIGPQGAQGLQGPAGPQGATGAQGPAGTNGDAPPADPLKPSTAANGFMKVDGIDGAIHGGVYDKNFTINTFSVSVTSSGDTHLGSGTGAGKATWAQLVVGLPFQPRLNAFVEPVATGKPIDKITINLCASDDPASCTLKCELTEVFVVSVGGTPYGQGTSSQETLALAFREIKLTNAQTHLAMSWNIATNVGNAPSAGSGSGSSVSLTSFSNVPSTDTTTFQNFAPGSLSNTATLGGSKGSAAGKVDVGDSTMVLPFDDAAISHFYAAASGVKWTR